MERWFWIAHVPAVIGWLALLAAPLLGARAVPVARIAAATLVLGYLALFFGAHDGLRALMHNYSLAGIGALFAAPQALLLGWVHYLAFDLWVASWEVEEGQRRGMSHWVIAPAVLLTVMLGPLGLLLFLALRAWKGRAVAG